MPPAPITILGGGPAGLAVAYYARQRNLPFLLLEASPRVGGNCATFQHGDFRYDSGAHRFHDVYPDITRDILDLMGEDLRLVHAPSQIYLSGEMVAFPLAPLDLIKKLGWQTLAKGARDFLQARARGSHDHGSFEEVVRSRYGSTIAELFLLKYSEKLWGLPAHSLSISISGRRLQGLDLTTFLVEMLRGPRNRTQHLDGKFYYPSHGYGMIADKLAAAAGSDNIQTEAAVTRIWHEHRKIVAVEINRSTRLPTTDVISTLPINLFLELLTPPPPPQVLEQSRQLRFRNLILVVLFLNQPSVTPNASVYFPEPHIPFTRLAEPRNRSADMAPSGHTSLVLELPCNSGDELWGSSDDQLSERVLSTLHPMGWIKPGALIGTQVRRIGFAYPVLSLGHEEITRKLEDYLAGFANLKLTGRNSLFVYTHLHDQMRAGRDLIDRHGKNAPE